MTDHICTGMSSLLSVMILTISGEVQKINSDLRGIFQKSIKNSLEVTLQQDYGFPNAICRSLSDLFEELVEVYFGAKRGPYQITFPATDISVPPGRAIKDLPTKMVTLTMFDDEDVKLASEQGMHALFLHRILRIANEALEQGALLTQAELAMLLGESTRTVGRAIKELAGQEIIVPTRGKWKDIGRGTSHKIPIIELFLKGYDFLAIKRKTKHSSRSVKRYLKEFARVYFLKQEGYELPLMIRMTGHSEKLLKEYLELIERYSLPEYEDQFEQLMKMIVKKNFHDIHTLIKVLTPDLDELGRDVE